MFLRRKKREERHTEDELVQQAIRQLRIKDDELDRRLQYLEKERGVYTVRDNAS